jgi:hypothetical protein
MKKILTLILLTAFLALGFTGCGGGTPELSDDEAMQVLGYAASIANPSGYSQGGLTLSSASPSIRALDSTVTLTSPDGGSVSVSYDVEGDGTITGSVDYNGLVVAYNNKKYILDGSYTLSMVYTMNMSVEPMTVTSTYSVNGTMEISGAGTANFDCDLDYSTNMEINTTTGASTITMSVTGTLGGAAVYETYNITM